MYSGTLRKGMTPLMPCLLFGAVDATGGGMARSFVPCLAFVLWKDDQIGMTIKRQCWVIDRPTPHFGLHYLEAKFLASGGGVVGHDVMPLKLVWLNNQY